MGCEVLLRNCDRAEILHATGSARAGSTGSNQVRWRGEVYNLLEDGFMRSDSRSTEREPEAILTA